jgi:hypothetical protein
MKKVGPTKYTSGGRVQGGSISHKRKERDKKKKIERVGPCMSASLALVGPNESMDFCQKRGEL